MEQMRIEICLNNRKSNSEPEPMVAPKMQLSGVITMFYVYVFSNAGLV